jgi:hypothetical protein
MIFTVAAVAAFVGCGGSGVAQRAPDLDAARQQTQLTMYWLGRRFEGLPLTYVDESTFIYGDCDASDGGCASPAEVQHWAFDPRAWALAEGCRRLPSLRGVPTARHDGLVLFTGRQFVKLYGIDRAQERRMAAALRPFEGDSNETLPPPPAEIVRGVDRACGPAPREP